MVHLLDDPLALSWLSRLGSQKTEQPEVVRILKRLYEHLAWVVLAAEFPKTQVAVSTRMVGSHPQAVYRGVAVDRDQKVVTVGIARAGTVPSQVLYEMLNEVLEPSGVRQDHLVMSRVTDEQGHVVGTSVDGSKTGTDIAGRIVLIPDPMGATGSSMSAALMRYSSQLQGKPQKMIAMHLIVTPEYLRRVTQEYPQTVVYALRYDRGLSAEKYYSARPGSAAEERGLDDHDYIVPGAGGLGEVLNNAWI